jgi:hypothetical protein
MYFIPLVLLIMLSIGILFGPILAVIVLVLFLLGLGLYKFFGPGTEPEHAPLSEAPAAGGAPVTSKREATEHGMWGEKRPDEQAGGEETP